MIEPGNAGRESAVTQGQDALSDPAWIAGVKDSTVARQFPPTMAGRAVVPHVSSAINFLST